MATEVMEKPLQYLDRAVSAVSAVKTLGIWPEQQAKERAHQQSISFFSTNGTVFTPPRSVTRSKTASAVPPSSPRRAMR